MDKENKNKDYDEKQPSLWCDSEELFQIVKVAQHKCITLELHHKAFLQVYSLQETAEMSWADLKNIFHSHTILSLHGASTSLPWTIENIEMALQQGIDSWVPVSAKWSQLLNEAKKSLGIVLNERTKASSIVMQVRSLQDVYNEGNEENHCSLNLLLIPLTAPVFVSWIER
jgi:hypothetical protein